MFHALMWYLPSTICNFEPTAIHNSESMPVKREGCELMQFKQCTVIEFLTEQNSCHSHSSPYAGSVWDKCVDVSRVRHWLWQFKQEGVEKASLVTKKCWGDHWLQQTSLMQNRLKKLFEKIVKSNRRTLLLKWESLKKEWATLSNFLDYEKFVPGGF